MASGLSLRSGGLFETIDAIARPAIASVPVKRSLGSIRDRTTTNTGAAKAAIAKQEIDSEFGGVLNAWAADWATPRSPGSAEGLAFNTLIVDKVFDSNAMVAGPNGCGAQIIIPRSPQCKQTLVPSF